MRKAGAQLPAGIVAPKQPPAFEALVKEHTLMVPELLQKFGDFPQCDAKTANSSDWRAILMEGHCDLIEEFRFDESDPVVTHEIRNRLARLVAICQAWDGALIAEDGK